MFNQISYLPVDDISSDKLGFKDKAEEIARFINKSSSRIPYAISINGPWGSGKSTMLNFVEEGLHKGKCKVIRFNPWMVTDREEMIKSLFEEIYYEIDQGITKAKEKFAKYAQKIVPSATKVLSYVGALSQGADPRTASMVGNSAGETAKGLGELFFDKPLSKRKQELRDEMEIMFAENGQKIVVMVDELDRLFPEEVITIFQMIKSSLDFPGIFFVVAMDEEVVFEALEKKGISRPDYYLQKIFQRSYYINTKFQTMTLTDHFILPKLDDSIESHKVLRKALSAYIYGIKEDFIFEVNAPSYYDTLLSDDWLPSKIADENVISRSYYTVLNSLRYGMNLQNPRTYLSFAEYVLEQWDNFYSHVFSKVENIPCFQQVAFLIFASKFGAPTFIEQRSFSEYLPKEEDNRPSFIREIVKHIYLIIPEFTRKKAGSNNLRENRRPLSVISESIAYLNKYPDYTRRENLAEND